MKLIYSLKNNYNKLKFFFFVEFYNKKIDYSSNIMNYINTQLSKFNWIYMPANIIFHCTTMPKCCFVKKNKRQFIKMRKHWKYHNNFIYCEKCDDHNSLEWFL